MIFSTFLAKLFLSEGRLSLLNFSKLELLKGEASKESTR